MAKIWDDCSNVKASSVAVEKAEEVKRLRS